MIRSTINQDLDAPPFNRRNLTRNGAEPAFSAEVRHESFYQRDDLASLWWFVSPLTHLNIPVRDFGQ